MLRIKIQRLKKIHLNWLIVFQYAFILCIILNFRSIWLHTDSLTGVSRVVKLLMGISVAGGVIAKEKFVEKQFVRCIIAMGAMALYVILWYFFDPIKSSSIFAIMVQLLAIIVYCMLVENSIDDTLHKFVNIVCVIAVVSLFFWVFGSILGFIKPTGYLYTTWTGNDALKKVVSYYGIYFETQTSTFFGITSNIIIRNTAIFTEAPMASMIFSVAFLVELLTKEKLDWKRCAILAAAIVSTISTTGMTILILAVGMRYIFTKAKSKGSLSLKILILPIVFMIALIALNYLLEQKLGTGSGSTRVDDFVAGYKAWMDAPIFGNGYGNEEAYIQYMSSFRSNNLGFSNSPMQILAFGGLYLLLPYLLAMGGILRLAKRRMWRRAAFYVVFLYSFVITVCSFQMLTWYIFISMSREGGRNTVPESTQEVKLLHFKEPFEETKKYLIL